MNDHQKMLATETYTMSLKIENSSSKKMRLWIEPWTYEYWLNPGEFLVLVARGPKAGYPTLYYENDVIVYAAWSKSVFAVYRDDELISHSLEECPLEPSGISWSQAQRNLRYRGEL